MKLRFGVLTISDRSARGERPDTAGPALAALVRGQGWEVTREQIVPDEAVAIRHPLVDWADTDAVDVVLTTGGTGFAPRDVTPEATLAVVDREAPGLAEAMRTASAARSPHAMLSRARAGIRGRTLIVNLPGSPRAAEENLQAILPALEHAVHLLRERPEAEAGHQGGAV
jgi:molybdenum cofactor synthesis domain-containing protein